MFVYVWEYSVAPAHVDEFREHYGPEGSWVKLFRRADGYRGTRLLRDRAEPTRFVTIDTWSSAEAHAAFLEQHGAAFRDLDEACEALTEAETLIGHFDSDGAVAPGND